MSIPLDEHRDQPPAATPSSSAGPAHELPEPHIRPMRWPFPLIWIIPIAAVIAACFYVYLHREEHGQRVAVTFTSASGIKDGETPVIVHGVKVGVVKQVTLADDQQHARVDIDLKNGASKAGSRGTKYWIVRPDVAGGALSGLSTLISGPYIEALPGDGPAAAAFTGLDDAPVLIGDGIRVVLTTDHLEHLQVNSGVYFRGIQVGAVQDIRLSSDSEQVNATIVIWRRFVPLLRSTSKFWAVKGADVKGGLFSGLQLQVNSIRTLIAGGVAFATPDADGGTPALDGLAYTLYDEPDKKWLAWRAHIYIDQPATETPNDSTKDSSSPVKMK